MPAPPPVLHVRGTVRSVAREDRTAKDTGEVRTWTVLTVLTDAGGFCDVWVPPEVSVTVPPSGLAVDAPVRVYPFTQRYGSEGKWRYRTVVGMTLVGDALAARAA